jgi:hypothetical protein
MISFLLHLSTRLVAETLTVLLLDARGMATPALKAVEVKVALCIVSAEGVKKVIYQMWPRPVAEVTRSIEQISAV